MFGDLPPSSRVTRLMVSAAPRMMSRPTSVEPVKEILATSGWATRAAPDLGAGARDHVQHPGGEPDLPRQLGETSAVSGV